MSAGGSWSTGVGTGKKNSLPWVKTAKEGVRDSRDLSGDCYTLYIHTPMVHM